MAGKYRIPLLLKAVDQLSRKHKEQFHWASFQWLIYSPGTKKA
jgi:hypothetical protein